MRAERDIQQQLKKSRKINSHSSISAADTGFLPGWQAVEYRLKI
jgi:hypothetical protein